LVHVEALPGAGQGRHVAIAHTPKGEAALQVAAGWTTNPAELSMWEGEWLP
jgi:hypothetical protein